MKPEYYIGIDMIDEEHKQLFLYADEAYELLNDEYTPDKYDRIDIILEKLRDYTVKHFADEEQYMESINYKKLFTQKIQHQEFIHKIDEFMEHHNDEVEDQDEQIMGILTYLTEWLVNHILYVDGQIPKGWYSKKRLSIYKKAATFYFSYNEIEFIMRREISIDESSLFKTFIKRDGRFLCILYFKQFLYCHIKIFCQTQADEFIFI